MWALINENKQQLEKKKKVQNFSILVFFEKKLFPKTKKPLITE